MSLFNVFDITATGMSAQSMRLNTTASNIANADSVSSSQGETYRARHPVFAAAMQKAAAGQDQTAVGVDVLGIVESNKPLNIEYSPDKKPFFAKVFIGADNSCLTMAVLCLSISLSLSTLLCTAELLNKRPSTNSYPCFSITLSHEFLNPIIRLFS